MNTKTMIHKKEYVKPTAKGQITIPVTIRKRLAITPQTLLEVTLRGHRFELAPVEIVTKESDHWETVVDFTQFTTKGIEITDLTGRLKRWTKSTKPSKS